MLEQRSPKREIPNDHAFYIFRDQLAALHIGKIWAIAGCPSIAHFEWLAINDKFKLRLDG